MSEPRSFLALPGEIRNQIYAHLFTLPSPSITCLEKNPLLCPAILSTCRKIHSEGSQILYGDNTFFAHPNLLSGLPRLRPNYPTISSPSLISLITRYRIRVRLDCDPNFSRQKAKEAFSGVQELTIEVFQAQFGSSDYKVLQLFEDIREVRRVEIFGSVAVFPEYVEWLKQTMMAREEEDIIPFEISNGQAVRNYDIWMHGGR